MSSTAAKDNWDAYTRGRDNGHDKYVARAKRCDEFFRGEQWSPEDLARLGDRPALTINMILSTVNTVLGEQQSQRAGITFKPRRDATAGQASTLTKLVGQIQDANQYEFVESQVFSDGLIEERGYFDVRVSFDDNIQGEIVIADEDPRDIIPDASAKSYDPREWNEVTKTRWMTLDDIELHYGKDKSDQIRTLVGSGETYGQDSIQIAEQTYGDVQQQDVMDFLSAREQVVRNVRVIERQWRKLQMRQFFVDNATGDMSPVPDDMDPLRLADVMQRADVSVIKKLVKRIRWTVSADHVLLMDEWSPYNHFTIVPYFPYFRRGKPFGLVTNLISPQEQLNKVESQELHVVNTTANSGWAVEAGSLVNMTEHELEERGAQTGLVLTYRRGSAPPDKIKPNQIPSGLDRIGQKAAASIRDISGTTAMLGTEGPEVSGVSLERQQSRGLVQMQVPFDNLNRTRRILADILLDLIQNFYTETRVFRVTNWESPEQEDEEVVINEPTPEGEILNDVTTGKYDVVVSSAPARDTFLDTQFAEALSLRKVGVMVPDDIIIESSNLARKHEIAKQVRQLTGRGDLTPEQQQMQAMMQEMQLDRLALELAELEGKAAKLRSDAMLTQAKAENEARSHEVEGQRFGAELDFKMKELRADIATKLTELQTKLQMAQVHSQAGLTETLYTTASKRAQEELKLRAATNRRQT